MSMPPLTFRFGGPVDGRGDGREDAGTVRLDPAVIDVEHADRPGENYLGADLAPATVSIGGRPHRWRLVDSASDVDEVENRYRPVGRDDLELVVRHSFRTVWVQRYALANTSASALGIDDLLVTFAEGETMRGWILTAGAEGFWLSQPADAPGPVLGSVLQFGEVRSYSVISKPKMPDATTPDEKASGWRTGPIELAAGGRYVVQWQADWYADVATFDRLRASRLPDRTELVWPQVCTVASSAPGTLDGAAGADVAVVVDPGLGVSNEAELTVFEPEHPGRYGVELRSSRGTFRFQLSWAEPPQTWIARTAAQLLSGARTPAGIARLPDSAAGIVVQQALADRTPLGAEAAEEALQRLTARLLAEPDPQPDNRRPTPHPLTAFDIALLSGESLRTGEREYADAARSALLATTNPEPGLGLAAARVSLAELAAGVSIGPILDHLKALVRDHPPGRPPVQTAEVDLGHLELSLVTRPQGTPLSDVLSREVLGLGATVGAGLPGISTRPLSAERLAQAAALLALLPDAGGSGWSVQRSLGWPVGPQALAERLRLRSLGRLQQAWSHPDGDPAAPESVAVLAWLVLSQPSG